MRIEEVVPPVEDILGRYVSGEYGVFIGGRMIGYRFTEDDLPGIQDVIDRYKKRGTKAPAHNEFDQAWL